MSVFYPFLKPLLGYFFFSEEDEFDYKEMLKRDKRRWAMADVDKDNKITKEEYTAFLHPEEYDHMKDVVVDETLEDIDKDGDGSVSIDEYLGMTGFKINAIFVVLFIKKTVAKGAVYRANPWYLKCCKGHFFCMCCQGSK